ncbi:MAG TPA: hypothetical protein VEC12_03440 [Bacteroidia bacterium]|nr:hypothetical protein [Bacteroidia bacterium]
MKKLILIFCLFLSSALLKAQVVIIQIPPNPTQFSPKDLWDINLVNNDGSKTVYLKGILKDELNRQLLDVISTTFTIENGNKKINKNEVGNEVLNFNSSHPNSGIVRDFNNLPYGEYSLCVYLYETGTNELLGESCMDYNCEPISPPVLINPEYCQEVNTKYPLFTWLAPSPQIRGQQVYYDFKLAEVYDGQSNEDAIQRNLAIVFAGNLTSTTFLYPSTATPLDSTKKYAWQVIAKIKKYPGSEPPQGDNYLQNIGVSESWCLNYKLPELPEIEVIKENITYAIPKLQQDAAINVYNILYLSYREDYVPGLMNFSIYDSKGEVIDINQPLKVQKGDNRYDINLKQTGLFTHNKLYKLVIKGSNNETYYLNFKYIEE